ncbi:MAG TPA: hypothetical protein VF258_08210 [Luteolibacter sp.]
MFFVIVCLVFSIQAAVAQEYGGPSTLADRESVPDQSGQSIHAPDGLLPEGFWKMQPKAAALALVEANRTPEHCRKFELHVDGFNPPVWGWFVLNFGFSSSYSSASSLVALRFGSTKPYLFQSGHHEVSGMDRQTDLSGHELRLIDVSVDEARFLVQVLFWLDRIRTKPVQENSNSRGQLDTADAGSLACRWKGGYDKEAFQRFADFLLNRELPRHLGERWKGIELVAHHDADNSLGRLKSQEEVDPRDQLTFVVLTALKRHRVTPWPASALKEVVECAGQAGLVRTLPALEDLKRALPPAYADEREFRKLDEERAKGWIAGNPEHARHRTRHAAIAKKFEFYLPFQIRPALERSLRQLRAIDQSGKFMNLADGSADSGYEQGLVKSRGPALLEVFEMDSGSLQWDRRSPVVGLLSAHPFNGAQ